MIEVIDLGAIMGTGGTIYYLIHKEIDKAQDKFTEKIDEMIECINSKHLTNSNEITRIKARVGID